MVVFPPTYTPGVHHIYTGIYLFKNGSDIKDSVETRIGILLCVMLWSRVPQKLCMVPCRIYVPYIYMKIHVPSCMDTELKQ